MTAMRTIPDGDRLRHSILRHLAPLLRATGSDDHELGCRLEGSVSDLHVVLTGPESCAAVREALGVRVLDAVHADGRTFGAVTIATRFGDEGRAPSGAAAPA